MGFVAYPLSFTPRVPYTMPQFRAVVPTPGTTGSFDLLGFPAGEDSVRKIKDVRPAAEIIAEMMTEAREILGEELTEMSGRA
jgi:enoyl-[acyl-carrier protein] reductase II